MSARRSRSAMLLGLAVVVGGPACFAGPAADGPVIFASSPADLAAGKARFKAGDPLAKKVGGGFIKAADEAMDAPILTVTSKPFVPPSGDKHDYLSLSPYWWPDPNKPDGKPYIRRDGEFNPEREKFDLGPMERMSNQVEALSMAYYLTGEEKYAERAARQIRAWCIDPETRMNPNLTYGQNVPGLDIIRASGVIEGGRLKKVVDAVGLIRGSKAWTEADDKATKDWFRKLMNYIETSPQGKDELGQPNNHATWAHVQVATYALFVGEDAKAKALLESDFKHRIEAQIKPDGSQPEEMTRTQSWHYHRFNLNALMDEASLGERVGLDLWNYKTADGRSLRTALDYLIPAATGEAKWAKEDIREPKYGDLIVLLRRAANAYGEPKYEAAAKKMMEKERREQVDFLYPAKLK